MMRMMRRLAHHHQHFPFPRLRKPAYRFYYDNPYFGCHDASVLFSMLREFNPRRVIEIGCGHSSCLLLDTNERFFSGELDLILVDPSMSNAERLFGERGANNARLIRGPVQNLSRDVFKRLEANDILFLDSSHVSKTASDVNYLFFKIFPILKPGVLIHIHDILYPFEYPEGWVLKERRSWNEAYLLHAFLQYNSSFEIIYWNSFIWHQLHEELGAQMPLCLENEGGSIWLRRLS